MQKTNFNGHDVRFEIIENEVWFLAVDLQPITGHTNLREAIRMTLDLDEVREISVQDKKGSVRPHKIISESGFYKLVFNSKLPLAKEFTKYVTKVILPQIRKTGTFGNNQLQANVTALQLGEQKVDNLSKQIALLNKERRYEKMNNDKIKIFDVFKTNDAGHTNGLIQ
ncbi:hypothetical protein B0A58_12985 [Flavobacterium branchiophilum NBRC 15030 = ATCC 35035]|uniref:BRO family protein n=1 Tax=Flavobacterium branchiophilum TaxID=55197 RepID=A0A543G3J6_9FLAO|nr:BRO family protein [Flavobacterium branchiophilum]OXA72101.1 hypothetical protein B0A58_12985 [Flavobacterium branchiophilum NBRC 15030 = ATCC 35035]TQM40662.1 BRO family protein [Flavobacterium branchiophilum]GEM54258.1 hypothetical protein FB1_04790 [Flavobacterium branchiophilum NBRC 15030 = ATCC 35035]